MHRLNAVVVLLLNLLLVVLFAPQTHAASPNLVIYQVQAGGLVVDVDDKTAATREYISIYNSSDADVDISNWCLTNKANTAFACFNPAAVNESLHLPAHKFATVSSDNFANANNFIPDVNFITTNKTSGSIIASGDIISLIDPNGAAIDVISWTSTLSLSGGYVLQRQFTAPQSEILVDTDSTADFQKVNGLEIPSSGVEEWVMPDVCLNVDGIQASIPIGFISDGRGECDPEIVDVCTNLAGVQADLPDGFRYDSDSVCALDLLPIKITEMLPNASGSDDGNEYIEFYNPNDIDVDLSNYIFYVGVDNSSFYSFPTGSRIKSGAYLVLYNKEVKFTLINTNGRVQLRSIDGFMVDESSAYTDPDEDMAWSLIDNTWQYTNQPTPNEANLSSLDTENISIDTVSSLQPCAANQYRSPETNRCRLIVAANSVLAACKDGQYRSEETNRCRNIVSDISSQLPCAEGQERNPVTNRCRVVGAVLGASTLAACKASQERNPETNRCRNIVNMPIASYTPKQTEINSRNEYIWWSFVGVSLVAVIYGAWEWRYELLKMLRVVKLPLHFKK